tara:strand:+ start:480 stop:749 length:270 start_codon:yes stop_codon:yes gene_type:complete
MKHIIKFNKAILSLQPNAKFSAKGIDENNSEITDWVDDTIPQPSASEINAKITEIENIENNKPANRASGKQKLKDLGLNDDEIQALIGV